MKQRYLSLALAALVMTVMVAVPAFAQSSNGGGQVGQDFFTSLQDMITGNVGFFLGLGLTVLGIWVWVVQQKTGAGVVMIIGGVLITLSPSLFNSTQKFLSQTLGTVGGGNNELTPGTINSQ